MRKLATPKFPSRLLAPLLVTIVALLPRSVHGQTREINSGLAGQLRMVQLRVASGRVTAVGPASQQNVTANHTGGQQRERLSIELAGGLPTFSYERATRVERLSFELVRGQKLSIHVIPHSPAEQPTIEFSQPAEGPLTLTISTPGKTETYSGPSLWHLLILAPEACREHLLPLLEMVRPHWELDQQAREIEAVLCRRDAGQSSLSRAHWQRSLTALASDRYADREQAERELRQAGPVVISFLRAQSQTPLDVEQAFRVRRILRSLAADGDEDTPERVASWLSGDARIWLKLLEGDSSQVRGRASDRLASLLDTTIDFDPDGTPEERRQQVARLRERFADSIGQ